MRQVHKGFTLIELLVVIAIIALLLSIVMPSLRKARELGQRVVCTNQLRTLGMGNALYSNNYGGYFVPVRDSSLPNGSQHWLTNKAFRSYLDIDAFRSESTAPSSYVTPQAFLCPSDKISIDPANISAENVLTSYGYNITDWGWNYLYTEAYTGFRTAQVRAPAFKLVFVDGIDWWLEWRSADYTKGWDLLGQASINEYRAAPYNIYGPTLYRHSEGANVAFYDGHVEYMNKRELFVPEDRTPPRRPGIWSADMAIFLKNNNQ